MQKLIFFDLDGTLSPAKSWFVFNTYFGISPEEDEELFQLYMSSGHDYQTWIQKLTKLLQERGRCSKKTFDVFLGTLEFRPDAKETIAACKECGYTTILVSGAIDQIAKHAAKVLGIEEVYSGSEIVWDQDGNLEKIVNKGDEAIAKLQIFETVCTERGVDPTQTIMVGDGGNDLAIFKTTKKAILLGDYEPLKPFAWKQIQKLSEIIALL